MLTVLAVGMSGCFTKNNPQFKTLARERDSLTVLVAQLTDSLYNCQRTGSERAQGDLNQVLEKIQQQRHENNTNSRATMPVRPR